MNKAAFLDRDGVLNNDYDYVSKIEDFEWKSGIFELLRSLRKKDYDIFVVTNQSGIGRGYYSLEDFNKLTLWMLKELKQQDIAVKKVYYCPHSPEEKCDCRKPNPGMILEAAKDYGIDIKHSIMIGDKNSDMLAAKQAAINTRIFVVGKEGEQGKDATFQADNLHQVIDFIKDL